MSVAPPLSVTRTRTVYVPAASNVCATDVPEASLKPGLDPKSHSVLAIVPSESVESDVNCTCSPTTGSDGEYVKLACGGTSAGGRGAVMATVFESMSCPPRLSVTRRRTVYVPAVVKVWVTEVPDALVKPGLEPKSHSDFTIVPSGSVDVEVNVTVWPVTGAPGENVKSAWGRWLGRVSVTLVGSVRQLFVSWLSYTRRVLSAHATTK